MMLSFLKLHCHLKDLRCIFFNKSSPMKFIERQGLTVQNHLLQFKFCTSATNKKDDVIPLEEISTVVSTHKNFSVEKLPSLLEDISRHKNYGKGLPEKINLIDVRDLLECETSTQRSKYLTYLFKKEKIKQKSKEKNLMNKPKNKNIENLNAINNHIQYGLGKNTLFLRTLRRSIMRYYEKRLSNAALFGHKLVIDLGYDKFMTKKEKKACISQIRLLYSYNRLSRDPYDLYLCNAGSDNRCVEYLRYEMPNVDESFATITEQSYLSLFPKEDLVYLSPHASEALSSYDPRAVYIIGGFVDTVKRENVSSFKAQEEGIKSYRLPLEEFVAWGIGSKSLTINQVFSILQTKRDTGDWKEAFKHLPSRKIKRIDANSDNAELYNDKLYAINSS